MTKTLCDQMVAHMPSLRWTRPMSAVAVCKVGKYEVARVYRRSWPGRCWPLGVVVFEYSGSVRSPRHAATTIRRKLLEFRAVIDAALADHDDAENQR